MPNLADVREKLSLPVIVILVFYLLAFFILFAYYFPTHNQVRQLRADIEQEETM